MNGRLHVAAPLCLTLLFAVGCEQVKALKPSNSDEGPREQDDGTPSDTYRPDASATWNMPRDAGSITITNPPSSPTNACAEPRLMCGRFCTDVSGSAAHCGKCDNVCPDQQRCVAGVCTCYGAEQVICDGACRVQVLGVCGKCGEAESCKVEAACEDGQQHTADWSSPAGDLRRSGYNAGERGQPPLTKAWAISVSTTPLNQVAVSGSRIFVSARVTAPTKSTLQALEVQTGTQLWSRDFLGASAVGAPVAAGCRVYVEHGSSSAGAARLWSLSASDGEAVWGRASPVSLLADPPLVTDTTLYARASEFGGPAALTRANGEMRFQIAASASSIGGAMLAFHDGQLYVYLDGRLERRDASSDVVLDSVGVNTNTRVRPAIAANGTAYLIANPSVYAFEPKTRRLLWQAGTKVSSPIAVAEGLALIIDDGILTARDASTGASIWSAAATKGLTQAPIAAHGFAYVASPTETYAVSLATGEVVWQELGGGPLSIGAGHLFVAGQDGILRAYKLTQPVSP